MSKPITEPVDSLIVERVVTSVPPLPDDDLNAALDPVNVKASAAIVLVGIVLGVLGDLLFFHNLPGLNVVLYAAVFVGVAFALVRWLELPINRQNALFVVPALFFFALIALISADYLSVLNALAGSLSLLLVILYLTDPAFLGHEWNRLISAILSALLIGWIMPVFVLTDTNDWRKQALVKLKREHTDTAGAMIRGCLLALPILAVFALLFSSADVVFSSFLRSLFSWISFDGLGNLTSHALVIGLFGWFCIAGLGIMIRKLPYYAEGVAEPVLSPELGSFLDRQHSENIRHPQANGTRPKAAGFRLSIIESSIILGSVDLLFLVFVLIQARYLFGGRANITAQGYTYADYARRGFFELLAVSVFTLLLMLALDQLTRRSPRQERLFQGLGLGMIAMTVIILTSAFLRLSLYEDAYGFTRLRVISHVFIVWLGVLFAVLAWDLLRAHRRLFWAGAAAVAFGFLMTLNVLNVDAFIAARNMDRFHESGKIDVTYLTTLSNDAVPAMVPLLDDLDSIRSINEQNALQFNLRQRLVKLDRERSQRRFLGYHWGEDRAWKALDAYRNVLLYP